VFSLTQLSVAKIDIESLFEKLKLNGFVGVGKHMARTLKNDPTQALSSLKLVTAQILNSLSMTVGTPHDEPSSHGFFLRYSQVDPEVLLEANLVVLADYMHFLETYQVEVFRDKLAVTAAVQALIDGASAIADYRQHSHEELGSTADDLRQFALTIGSSFARWAASQSKR
jgi:hypothetical protein